MAIFEFKDGKWWYGKGWNAGYQKGLSIHDLFFFFPKCIKPLFHRGRLKCKGANHKGTRKGSAAMVLFSNALNSLFTEDGSNMKGQAIRFSQSTVELLLNSQNIGEKYEYRRRP